MANTHDYFRQFEINISVPLPKIDKLRTSRKALETRIKEHFRTKPNVKTPKFYIQGSYKMKTMVLGKDGTYDVDLGIYFLEKPTVEPMTLQKWVAEAVKDHTTTGVEHREKCIRVIYKGDFDIDLPVYYMGPKDKHPFLATKTKKWMESDPKELCDWFATKKDKGGQVLRLVKYFKAWANSRAKKMPSGIAFTVWVATFYKASTRDDISFLETAKAIKQSLWWNIKSKNPATPGDDFLAKLDDSQKSHFKEVFSNLIIDAEEAIMHKDTAKSCHIWRKQFGERFPLL